MTDDLLTMPEIIQCVADMRTQDVKAIREFGKFVPAFDAFEKNRLSLYREAAKEAEEIFDRWADVYKSFLTVIHNRRYVCYILQFGFAQGVLFANIASSPFIMQEHYGFSMDCRCNRPFHSLK